MAKKYIDAERLKAEIEFAKSVYDSPNRVVSGVADAFRQDGRVAMCDDILKTIDSLQQEQPCEDLDLEKEIDKTVNECTDGYNFDWDRFALHFYELGRKQ